MLPVNENSMYAVSNSDTLKLTNYFSE